jgi:PGF-pre-PGF domain-containing protein
VVGPPAPTLPEVSHVWSSITPTEVAKMTITREEIAFTEISFEVHNPANNVKLTITKLDAKPAAIVHEVIGKVYKYIEIKPQNIEDANIKAASIKFKVAKSWLTDNNLDPDTVTLNRYTTKWDALPTTKVDEGADNIYYNATTPGFSVFAISAQEKVPQICTPNITRCVDNEVEQCNPEGTAWVLVETCVFGCADGRCNPPPQICTPGEVRCSADAMQVQQCSADGTTWTTLMVCEFGCFEGQCKAKPVSYLWLAAVIPILAITAGVIVMYLQRKKVQRKELAPVVKEYEVRKPSPAVDRMHRYIKTCLEAGYLQADIRQALIDAGWDSTAVDNAIDTVLKERGEL